jgi:hypothetical protein
MCSFLQIAAQILLSTTPVMMTVRGCVFAHTEALEG